MFSINSFKGFAQSRTSGSSVSPGLVTHKQKRLQTRCKQPVKGRKDDISEILTGTECTCSEMTEIWDSATQNLGAQAECGSSQRWNGSPGSRKASPVLLPAWNGGRGTHLRAGRCSQEEWAFLSHSIIPLMSWRGQHATTGQVYQNRALGAVFRHAG